MVGNPNVRIDKWIKTCLQTIDPNFQPDIPVLRFEVKGNSFKAYLNIPNLTYELLGREM